MSKKRLIALPKSALEQLQQEQIQSIQWHLDELGKIRAIKNADFDTALKAELARAGVPAAPSAVADVMARCIAMSEAVSAHKLKAHYEEIRFLIRELKVTDVPEPILWAARQCGVNLLPEDEASTPSVIEES